VNLKIQQLDVIIETKTKDNVLWNLKFLCNLMVKGLWCFYKLEYAHDQITSFDVVRAEVPKLKLDDVLKEKMI
jgi:hypothetical protein